MAPIRKLLWVALAAALLMPSTSSAQRSGEIVFFSEANFRGRTFVVTGPRESTSLPFVARSARVAPGEAWEVCPQTSYRGNCQAISQSQGNIAWTVSSVRPRARPTLLPAPVPGNGQSLRGLESEYFPQPSERGFRLLSCPNGSGSGSCAGQSADRFCQSRGWSRSSFEREETIAGRKYLADVLCTRNH
jgi:hypothetical protein